MERTLTLDKGSLTFRDDGGNVIASYNAEAGRELEVDSSRGNKGPLPPGTYTIYPEEISGGVDMKWIKWNACDGDWGIYRVPLHPNEGTNLYNRSGFFLHGGILVGSAGCIDVGTPNDIELFNLMKQSNDPILVIVTKHPNRWQTAPEYRLA